MILSPTTLLIVSLCGYGVGAAGGLLFMRREKTAAAFSFGVAAFSALCGLLAGLLILAGAPANPDGPLELLPPLIPGISPLIPGLLLTVRLDALGAFFLVIASLLGVAVSIYSLGYARSYFGRKNVGALGAFYNAMLLATALLFVADNIWVFLIAWELMALTAYCLVSFEHEQPETRRAGVLFFIMSHIDAGFVMLGFLLLYQASGDYSFGSLHHIGEAMSPGKRNAAFVLFLLGFGIKSGVVPLHVWLPAAHPVAPSNVSALMSGVLINAGIYGLARVCFDFLGPAPLWWGVTILAVGTVSAVLGVLYALMEHDLKRLLAYSSIENIGIMLMGMGASLIFLAAGHPPLAALSLIAGMYHMLNHASFKGLLFLGAGAVVHATHTRNMEEMGGLARRMPETAFYFLIGAIAISALPPLNGFVSEWLTYQSLLQGFGVTDSLWRLAFPLSGAMLALTGALAAACFVKAFGITFLAQPRSEQAARAVEAAPTMRMGMAVLAAACVALGLFPAAAIRLLDPLTRQLTGEQISGRLNLANGLALASLAEKPGTFSTTGMVLTAVCLLPIPLALWLLLARKARTRRGPTWACGQPGLTPQMEYTATGFSKPVRMIFKALFRPRSDVQREYDFSPYFATNIRFESHIEEVFVEQLYRPLRIWILRASRRMRAVQAGNIHAYLLYIFVTLVLLLLFAL
jgi:hydrogenase-4 component B